MAPVAKSLKLLSGFLGSAIKSFAIAFIVIDLFWGGFLAAITFWIASQSSLWQGVLAVIWTIIVMSSLGIAASVQFSIFATVKRAVRESQLGSQIFEKLINRSQLISEPDPLLAVSEIQRAMNTAADEILGQDDGVTDLSSVMFWFARKMQRIAVWATARVIVKSCSEDGETVRFSQVRDRLGKVIDQRVIAFLSGLSWKIVSTLIGLATALVALGCFLICRLPPSI